MFLLVSAANCSHLQGAASVEDMYSTLYRLSNIKYIYIYIYIHSLVLIKLHRRLDGSFHETVNRCDYVTCCCYSWLYIIPFPWLNEWISVSHLDGFGYRDPPCLRHSFVCEWRHGRGLCAYQVYLCNTVGVNEWVTRTTLCSHTIELGLCFTRFATRTGFSWLRQSLVCVWRQSPVSVHHTRWWGDKK